MAKQRFGGEWTIEKLDILSSYLSFYLTVLKKQLYKKIYIDAFAGTGSIQVDGKREMIEGSARLALNAHNKFDHYIFIEQKKKFALELNQMVAKEFTSLSDIITVYNDECNSKLMKLCEEINWKDNRAVLFLDPFATEVQWTTLRAIASTKAIDVWYLFPLNAVTRLMKNKGDIEPSWRAKLDMIIGDKGWYDRFYINNPQQNIFGKKELVKVVNTDGLKEYICERLETIFPAVAPNPRILYNMKRSPLFLFCFAVSNDSPKAIKAALNGANYILNNPAK